MKLNRFSVNKSSRAVLLRNGDFDRVLPTGNHWLWSWFDKLELERASVAQAQYFGQAQDYLLASPNDAANAHFQRVVLSDTQAGLLYENGLLTELLAPGTRRLYWKDADIKVELIDLSAGNSEGELSSDALARITQSQLKRLAVQGLTSVLQVQVHEHHVGLLTIDGKLQRSLGAGNYAFWRHNRNITVEIIDLRVQSLEVSGQEILTRDKVALRLNLAATWRYADVLQSQAVTARPTDDLYRELQFALRMAVGTQSLDELLENKAALDEKVANVVRERVQRMGLVLESVGVKDIILPGEMKAILSQVVEAEKVAQANLIRRREETAASRSLLNTAKVMEDNPVALRLKELETLERVADRIDQISVFGGLDGVLNALRPSK
jgi:regulator of protease activity HflC (stomatin/prohibitin superfamily)